MIVAGIHCPVSFKAISTHLFRPASAAVGLVTTAQDRARGWNIYIAPDSVHGCISCFWLSSAVPSLLCPADTYDDAEKTSTYTLWRNYSFRLVLSFAFAVVTAFVLAFLGMTLLNAGVI